MERGDDDLRSNSKAERKSGAERLRSEIMRSEFVEGFVAGWWPRNSGVMKERGGNISERGWSRGKLESRSMEVGSGNDEADPEMMNLAMSIRNLLSTCCFACNFCV